jgi:hypothetical protein
MPKFYVTYSFNSNLKDNYSIVEADCYDSARDEIFNETEGKFAFMYDEESFEGQADKYGLSEVPLQQQLMLSEDY